MGEDNSFLLVDLKEDKAKKLAQVISNDSCRKILEYLTHKDKATETEISNELKLALSTVHYNLTHLSKSGLVVVEEFHYSQKGKEVNHYKLANKFIIIAPSNNPSFMEKLKKILPLGIFAIVGAGAIQAYNFFIKNNMVNKVNFDAAPLMQKAAADESTRLATSITQTAPSEPNLALWFLAGSVFIILIVLIMNLIKKK